MEQKLTSILLVDDDDISNYITESLISEMNISEEVAVVTDGQQALDYIGEHEIVAQNRPGHILVLLDLNMPVMDGFEFMEEYEKRNWRSKVSVVMLTSSSNPKDLNNSKNFGFAGYLQKPFDQNDVRQLLSDKGW
jgi:CheY-like chemotaxis protein